MKDFTAVRMREAVRMFSPWRRSPTRRAFFADLMIGIEGNYNIRLDPEKRKMERRGWDRPSTWYKILYLFRTHAKMITWGCAHKNVVKFDKIYEWQPNSIG
jgi:hypothetical protein